MPTKGTPVVLITDASLDSTHKAGGWACYGSKNRQRIRYGAAFKTSATWDTTAAEMMAVLNGINFLKVSGMLARGDHLIVYMDNVNSRQAFLGNLAKGKYTRLKQMFHDEIKTGMHTFEIKHIKAHQKGKRMEPKYQAHEWVDLTARYHMQTSRLCQL